jgi:glyoxylase-like metal-dependent hydrolase (beta-lactamase superfamily II)
VAAERARRVLPRSAAIALAAAAGCVGDHGRHGDVDPPPARPPVAFLLRYSGSVEVDSEFERGPRPGPVATELRTIATGAAEIRVEQKLWFDGRDAPPALETTIVSGERVWRSSSGDGPFRLLADPEAKAAREFAELLWRSPAPIAGGSGDSEVRRERWLAHPRLGDVRASAWYRRVSAEQGRPVAHELDFEWYGATTRQKASLAFVEAARDPGLARELGPPANAAAQSGDAPRVKLDPIADGLYTAEESESGVRSLVVLFERELLVVEAPLSSAAGERIVDALAGKWPKRPIGHVLFSDPRPRFSGGLRAFLAAGATIVTTPAVAPQVEEAVVRPFTIAPDRLARRGGSLRIESFSEGRRFADAANELDALVLAGGGPEGGDAVVFWLPRARLLFVGEGGVARAADGSSRASPEALALRELVKARKLDVERLLPALPEKGATGPTPFDGWVRSLAPVGR